MAQEASQPQAQQTLEQLIGEIKKDSNLTEDYIKQQIARNSIEVNAQNSAGWTALISAAYIGDKEVVEILLTKLHADANLKDSDGWTALMYAPLNGHADVVELLLNRGADVNAPDKFGKTALYYAKDTNHTEIVKLLQAAYKVKIGLTYKHNDEYILSQLKDIDSKLTDQVQDANDRKTQFTTDLLEALKDDSFAIYRLYNIIHKENEVKSDTESSASTTLEDQIHKELQSKYNELFSIEKFFYSIWHFLEEYVIFPILGDHETLEMGYIIHTDSEL